LNSKKVTALEGSRRISFLDPHKIFEFWEFSLMWKKVKKRIINLGNWAQNRRESVAKSMHIPNQHKILERDFFKFPQFFSRSVHTIRNKKRSRNNLKTY
jgi:hypothetical protein